MALRLRKDVQKASYYVWFLGAEEARGLRGPRVLLPAIPHLIERSREHEPLKVTLQVSHKGMKIVQGSSKHFITHSAITCSVQTEDIVACVLLLYNPTTKCPLHVHAYRCDSETTAQALHQFLQVLINRPENQKRFSELEARLGLPNTPVATRTIQPKTPQKRTESSPRRFESSLGSDTGTSTRESECSEELSPTSPTTPISPIKTSLYDSLAAELRAKLNGNGPPLLLPPRDYDTVHRSKGNLAATELRRCRNSLIVGGPGTKQPITSRSRGSSGIGSDLAPSPERHDGHSSSDDDWIQNNQEQPMHSLPTTSRRPPAPRPYAPERTQNDHFDSDVPPPSYLYPRESPRINYNPIKIENKRYERSSSREEEQRSRSQHSREEEDIKPIIIRPRNFDSRFKDILDERKFVEDNENEDDRTIENEKIRSEKYIQAKQRLERKYRPPEVAEKRYFEQEVLKNQDGYRLHEIERRKPMDIPKYIEKDIEYQEKGEKENIVFRENLTDRQKYRETLIEKQKISQNRYKERPVDREFYKQEPISRHSFHESFEKSKIKNKSKYDNSQDKPPAYKTDATMERNNYRHRNPDKNLSRNYNEKSSLEYEKTIERNPYKEADSLPYIESIERMIKSPVMRYKSFEDNCMQDTIEEKQHIHEKNYPSQGKIRESSRQHSRDSSGNYPDTKQRYEHIEHHMSRRRIIENHRSESRSPETIMKVSPKDRFQDAKEKFQAMERDRHYMLDKAKESRRMEPPRRGSLEHSGNVLSQHIPHDRKLDWSSDDEQPILRQPMSRQPMSSGYRDISQIERFSGIDNSPRVIGPAKSLGNLVKGYRHSYAEPQNHMPRNSGRVGLAAVNPF